MAEARRFSDATASPPRGSFNTADLVADRALHFIIIIIVVFVVVVVVVVLTSFAASPCDQFALDNRALDFYYDGHKQNGKHENRHIG